jgi:hypothetical protein
LRSNPLALDFCNLIGENFWCLIWLHRAELQEWATLLNSGALGLFVTAVCFFPSQSHGVSSKTSCNVRWAQ